MRRKLGNFGAFTANFPNPVWITNSGGMLLVTTILRLIPTNQHCLEISQTSNKNWRLEKNTKCGYHGMLGWIEEAKKTLPSNPDLILKIEARKVKRRKGFSERARGHSDLTANFIDF